MHIYYLIDGVHIFIKVSAILSLQITLIIFQRFRVLSNFLIN